MPRFLFRKIVLLLVLMVISNQIEAGRPSSPHVKTEAFSPEKLSKKERFILRTAQKMVERKLKKVQKKMAKSQGCDELFFRNGTSEQAKILEITDETITYLKCNHLDGPNRVIKKSEVASILFANGERVAYNAPPPSKEPDYYTPQQGGKSKVNGFSVASLIFGVLGFFPLPFLGGALAIVLGAVGLGRSSKDKTNQNAVLAALGIFLGILSIVLWTSLIIGIIAL